MKKFYQSGATNHISRVSNQLFFLKAAEIAGTAILMNLFEFDYAGTFTYTDQTMKNWISIFVLLLAYSLVSSNLFAAEEEKLVPGLSNESKAGIVITAGNSRTQTYDLTQKSSYEWNANKLSLLGTYLRSTSKGIESARRWSLGFRYDRILADRWAIFAAETIEGDIYAGYLQRYNSDIGGKYTIIKDPMNIWFVEAGYRHQHENQVTGLSKNSSFGRGYTEYEHLWNPLISTKLWLEYLQNLSNGTDYFLNSEASIKAAISNVFSVQLAYLVRYRNLLPVTVEFKTDTTFTAAVLAKF